MNLPLTLGSLFVTGEGGGVGATNSNGQTSTTDYNTTPGKGLSISIVGAIMLSPFAALEAIATASATP